MTTRAHELRESFDHMGGDDPNDLHFDNNKPLGPPRRVLAITCAKCGLRVVVRSPDEQRRRKHCSRRCAALNRPPIAKAAADRGRALAGAAKRRATLAALEGLTPLQAFRRGYMNGLRSKLVQLRKHYTLVPRDPRT